MIAIRGMRSFRVEIYCVIWPRTAARRGMSIVGRRYVRRYRNRGKSRGFRRSEIKRGKKKLILGDRDAADRGVGDSDLSGTSN